MKWEGVEVVEGLAGDVGILPTRSDCGCCCSVQMFVTKKTDKLQLAERSLEADSWTISYIGQREHVGSSFLTSDEGRSQAFPAPPTVEFSSAFMPRLSFRICFDRLSILWLPAQWTEAADGSS